MSLKTVIPTLDAVPEAFRGEYEPHEGGFRLKLDGDPVGYVPVARHAEFRENNVRVLKALGVTSVDEALARAAVFAGIDPAKLDKLKAIDPEEYAALKTEAEKLKGKGLKNADDLQATITAAVTAAIGPVKAELEGVKAERQKAQARADEALLREAIGTRYMKAGGRPDALEFFLSKAKESFRVDGGEVKAVDGKLSPKNFDTPLTIDEWLGQATKEYGFAFEPSKGGGASGSNGNGGANSGRPSDARVIRGTREELQRVSSDLTLDTKGRLVDASGKLVVFEETGAGA